LADSFGGALLEHFEPRLDICRLWKGLNKSRPE